MPKDRKYDLIRCQNFTWTLFQRGGVWYADGRTNEINPGRHSLGTRIRAEAEQNVAALDTTRAIDLGLAKPAPTHSVKTTLTLLAGRQLYEEYLGRPRISGGVKPSTKKRYKTVFDKFLEFAQTNNVTAWNDVDKRILNRYAAHLESRDYKTKTLRNELTTLGQAIRWLVEEEHLTGYEPPKLKLKKVESERAYCYEPAEVSAMVAHCRERSDLDWMASVITGLACTGLRISELAALRWSDIDLTRGMLTLTDESGRGSAKSNRQLKSGRSRSLPLHTDLSIDLQKLTRRGTLVFYGPRGGKLKPDTVRNILIRDVLTPLVKHFPSTAGKKSFADGRLHSFRHYFASMCANQRTPERVAMEWLGHADSEMVRHYYHLHDAESRQQMAKLVLLGDTSQQPPGDLIGVAPKPKANQPTVEE
ncbi:tyrosine-type recombinase/integrase [Anatilimnocola floriformis]|uniref:tyrosine-type recombinase/integrase n=1 Tax=Anatilimnocola floriformis TaxID=2948575 RepID=UPI0020C42619|nr:site-specific integrase [Anatilimnocola floriformis]